MRILLLSSSINEQVSATHIYSEYANYFASQGHAVTLYYGRPFVFTGKLAPGVTLKFPPRWISALPDPGLYNPLHVLVRLMHVLTHRYDVIHVCPGHRPAHLFPAVMSKWLWKSVIADEWWEWFGKEGLGRNPPNRKAALFARLDEWFEIRSKRHYDLIFPIASALQRRLDARTGARVILLHGGVDTRHLVPHPKQEARARLGVNPDWIVVGLCGACPEDHEDNLPFLKAFARVARANPRLRLLLTGRRKYIDRLCTTELDPDRIIDIGWQPYEQYNLYMSACDAFALPFPPSTRNVGRWPNKITDYIWLGRGVITNPTGDVGELLTRNPSFGRCVEATEAGYAGALESLCAAAGNWDIPPGTLEQSTLRTMEQRQQLVLESYEKVLAERRSR